MPFFITQYLKSLGDNFGQVSATVYRSAQPDQKRLAELYRLGIRVNLNLRNDLAPEEQAEVEGVGMEWVNIPLRDDEAPDPQRISGALSVLRRGDTTLVNCRGGRHRSGLVIACYRVTVQGWTKEDAWKEAYKFGFYRFGGHGALEDWFWNNFDEGAL